MGEYRFSVYGKWQIGINLSYEYGQILLTIPFMTMHFSIRKHAFGYNIFNILKK